MRHPAGLSILLFSVVALWLVDSCGPRTERPRERVLEFVKLVQSDSLPDVLSYIDPDSLAIYLFVGDRYDSLDRERKKQELLDGFMGDGQFRSMFTRSQIVVNEEKLLNDTTATVEVSYIERKSRIQYYTQMSLKKRGEHWYIVNLRVE